MQREGGMVKGTGEEKDFGSDILNGCEWSEMASRPEGRVLQ